MQLILVSAFAWTIAQITKLVIEYIRTKKINLYIMFASGGMPSSHSSFVVSLATQVGLIEGFNSTLFALSLGFSLIVIYDAAGVRHAVGVQARMLNQIIDDYYAKKTVNDYKVKEILGHTPLQVFAGILLGIAVGYIGYQLSM